jgi:hypothetical protein
MVKFALFATVCGASKVAPSLPPVASVLGVGAGTDKAVDNRHTPEP